VPNFVKIGQSVAKILTFLPCGICRRRVSVCVCMCMCVCVCLSVTLRYCIKTAKQDDANNAA